jgi:hypothetical protein
MAEWQNGGTRTGTRRNPRPNHLDLRREFVRAGRARLRPFTSDAVSIRAVSIQLTEHGNLGRDASA